MRMTQLVLSGLLITASLAIAAPANAGTTKTAQVSTAISKADLATPAGIQKVYSHLQKTAAESCQTSDQQTLTNRIMGQRCEARLMNDFISNVEHSGLTAYHLSRKSG